MLFSSITFLYYFLPLVLAAYFIVPKRGKNIVLLLASLIFYWWGEPHYVLLMVGTIIFSYLCGRWIGWAKTPGGKRVALFVSVAGELAVLGYFKYADFFLSTMNEAIHTSFPALAVALPIGISFYTFQTLSYTVDVYRGTVPVQRSPLKLAVYISMFPQLVAGPIVRYSAVERALSDRRTTAEDLSKGMQRFVIGLSKKVLLANQLGALCDAFRGSDAPSVLFYWLYAAAFTMQIYFDFSGYSDMAIGLGRVFGFHFMENFNYPLTAKSATEFWRRWHISLGSWFRDYVYIPLGGNRRGAARQLFNIFLVWALTGLWHGAAWNFMLWGLFYAVLLALEKGGLLKVLERAPHWLSHGYLLIAVTLGFVLFNGAGLAGAAADFSALFGFAKLPVVSVDTLYYLRSYAVVLIAAALGSTALPLRAVARLEKGRGAAAMAVVKPIVLAGLLLVCTGYLVDGSFNPFLYFRF